MSFVCPVCDHAMEDPPYDWNICGHCMTEFAGKGDHDITHRTIAEVRKAYQTEKHRARHIELHQAFDELLADYLSHHSGKRPSDTTLLELMAWSHGQTVEPSE